MAPGIHRQIQEKAIKITDPAGREVHVIGDRAALEIACRSGLDLREIYIEALKLSVHPYRYIRNMDIISPAEQLKLAESQVAVVGAGGLGGHVILLLARVGIGRLIVVDHDRFDETNLNRQALCSREALQKPKSRTALETVASINPAVRVIPHQVKISAANIDGILTGADVIVDALDNVHDRLMLQEAARRLGVPMVHGALAGFEGRIMTVYPDDPGLEQLYDAEETAEADPERPEALLGVPAVTAAIIGVFQTMEVLKILLNRGRLFRHVMAHIDLENGRFEEFRFDRPSKGNEDLFNANLLKPQGSRSGNEE
jgi:molybdopterin/thiamine biosynthesis adenylyltransferase